MKVMKVLWSIFSIAFSLAGANTEDLGQLRYVTNEFPPNAYIENGVLKGAGVELLREIWKLSGLGEQAIELVPFARVLDQTRNQRNTVAFAVTRNGAREKLFKWAGPILRSRLSLISLASKTYSINSFTDLKGSVIGVINKDIGETTLIEKNYPASRIEKVNSVEELISMLEYGRIDLACVNQASFFAKAATVSTVAFKSQFVVSETLAYFAFNVETPDSLVSNFQSLIDKLEKQRVEIMKRYGVLP